MSFLNYAQVAQRLDVNINTLRTWVRRGQIPHTRISAHTVRFDEEQLQRWIDSKTCDGTGSGHSRRNQEGTQDGM